MFRASVEQKRKLPPPSFSDSNAVKNSVFANPYVEEENNKMAVLEKHVKMVPQKTLMSKINGKKVCWMYRKGRCRFGHTCKFAHDSDIINPLGNQSVAEVESVVVCTNEDSAAQDTKSNDSNECLSNSQKQDRKRKKKPGLTQTLVPGKKVMKVLKKSNSSSLLAP